MSQIDKLTYVPVLFWFILFFSFFYFLIYSFFVPFIFSISKARENEYLLISGWGSSFFSLLTMFNVFSSTPSRHLKMYYFSYLKIAKIILSFKENSLK